MLLDCSSKQIFHLVRFILILLVSFSVLNDVEVRVDGPDWLSVDQDARLLVDSDRENDACKLVESTFDVDSSSLSLGEKFGRGKSKANTPGNTHRFVFCRVFFVTFESGE